MRRGFGKSGGVQPYVLRACRNGDYATGLDEQTDDLDAAIRAISRRSDADGSQIIALGVSVGGAAVLNLAAPAGRFEGGRQRLGRNSHLAQWSGNPRDLQAGGTS